MTRKKYSIFHTLMQKIGSTRAGALFFSKTQPHLDRFLLKLTRGKTNLTGLLSGLPVVLLTSRGAKSGLLRTTPLIGIYDQSGNDKIALIASNYGQGHHPAWYYNLKVNPQVSCAINGKAGKYAAYEAQGQEYNSYWQAASDLYLGFPKYQVQAGDRHIPIMVLSPIKE